MGAATIPIALALSLGTLTYVYFYRESTPDELKAWIDLPPNYQNLSGNQKAELLWSKVQQTKYSSENMTSWDNDSGGVPQLIATGFFSLKASFTCNLKNSDIMPVGRVRGIHNLGVVGRIKWTMSENVTRNNFTGLLANGASTEGIIRLSLIRPSAPDSSFMPGIGIKLLVDGRPSVNALANVDFDGQTNMNFFGHLFRTTVSYPTHLDKKILFIRFEMIEFPGHWLPVRDLARLTRQGKLIEKPVYPTMLEFRSHERVANLIANNTRTETRAELQQKLSPGPLLHVYAASVMDDPNAFKIGEVALETGVIASSFGDKKLCFKHQRHTPEPDDEF